MSEPTCPLCQSSDTQFLHRSDDRHGIREFHECRTCDLAFVPPEFHLPPDAEMQRYLMHDNDPEDVRYRSFLSRLWSPLRPLLNKGERGLDYGCGPGPALVQMMTEDGFRVEKYDLYFFPDPEPLARIYDFITCTETVEHLRQPMEVFALLNSILRPGGRVGIMTGILDERSKFGDWHYQRDPTHIAFYTRRTLDWIATRMGWHVEFQSADVTILAKRGRSEPVCSMPMNAASNPASPII